MSRAPPFRSERGKLAEVNEEMSELYKRSKVADHIEPGHAGHRASIVTETGHSQKEQARLHQSPHPKKRRRTRRDAKTPAAGRHQKKRPDGSSRASIAQPIIVHPQLRR